MSAAAVLINKNWIIPVVAAKLKSLQNREFFSFSPKIEKDEKETKTYYKREGILYQKAPQAAEGQRIASAAPKSSEVSVIQVEQVKGGTIIKTSVPIPNTPSDEDQVVLVCLLGWLGARWNHVMKFSDWYSHKFHMPCLTLIPRLSSIIIKPIADKQAEMYVQRLDQVIKELENQEYAAQYSLEQQPPKPVKVKAVFHALSGNGINMYGRIMQQLVKPEYQHLKDRITCNIVDSAPPAISADRFTRGFVGAIKTVFGAGHQPGEAMYQHWLLTPICKRVFNFYLQTLGKQQKYIHFRDEIIRIQPKSPQLYIYSEADILVPPEDVREFIELQRHQGIHVEEKLFKDSPHVAHFKKYPQEYMDCVHQFIAKHTTDKK